MSRAHTYGAVVLFCAAVSAAAGADMPEANIYRVERGIVRQVEALVEAAGSIPSTVMVTGAQDSLWLAGVVDRAVADAGAGRAPTGGMLEVVPLVLSTAYGSLDGGLVERTVTVHLRGMMVDAAGRRRLADVEPWQLRDTVARWQVRQIDQSRYLATHAELPPEPSSFWSDIAQPVVFVCAAVVTVGLLFTVRSR